jgi:indole-3-glycerol phosphate synthase
MHDYLKQIIEHKKTEVANTNLSKYGKIENLRSTKSFKTALLQSSPAIIAEIKRKSPAKGNLATIADPTALAKKYIAGGATAISVLTDSYAFNGSITDLQQISTALCNTAIVVLRKDFIIDPIQIDETILAGANAILLIVTILQEKTASLLKTAKNRGIDAIVEVHDRDELEYALAIGAEIIGINNRNLTTFAVNSNNAIQLKPFIPDHIVSIAESGIYSPDDAKRYIEAGYHALLIGEALVKAENPQHFIRQIRAIQQ